MNTSKPKSHRQIIYEHAEPYAKKHFQKIEVEIGEYMGNKMCQHNSRQKVETGEADTVAVTLSFLPISGMNVHFINRVGNEYVDHTLGYLSKANTYYLIREFTKDELQGVNMTKMLDETKSEVLAKIFTKEKLIDLEIKLSEL